MLLFTSFLKVPSYGCQFSDVKSTLNLVHSQSCVCWWTSYTFHVWRFPYNYHCFRERILCCRLQMGCCWSCCRFSRNLDCSRCWTFVLLHFEAACKWWSCTSLLVGRALYGWTLWRVRVMECKWRHFIYHFIAGWPSARNGLLVARTWTHRMHCISGCILL